MVVMGLHEAMALGVWVEELLPTSVMIQVANGITEPALGFIIVVASCRDESRNLKMTRQQAYVMRGAGQLFLSYEALEELGYIRGDEFLSSVAENGGQMFEPEDEKAERCTYPTMSLQ